MRKLSDLTQMYMYMTCIHIGNGVHLLGLSTHREEREKEEKEEKREREVKVTHLNFTFSSASSGGSSQIIFTSSSRTSGRIRLHDIHDSLIHTNCVWNTYVQPVHAQWEFPLHQNPGNNLERWGREKKKKQHVPKHMYLAVDVSTMGILYPHLPTWWTGNNRSHTYMVL